MAREWWRFGFPSQFWAWSQVGTINHSIQLILADTLVNKKSRVINKTDIEYLCQKLPGRCHMRQCQIRVQFESIGMQFFKVLKKWFWMTKYVPIILLWCSEKGFYKKSHLITCFRRFTNAPNHLSVYVRILGQVDFGKNCKSCQYWHWIFRVLH